MAPIADAIEAFRRGEFLVVVDDAERENEGDLVIAAAKATPEAIAFMVRHTSGLICVPATPQRLDELELPLMVADNTDSHDTAFTVSVDYRHGTTTGISAADRASTIRALVDPGTKPADLARPGHVFPLRACENGVLERPGHTEAAVDLARLAGLYPAGVVCEVVGDNGAMASGDELSRFAKEHDILLVSISDLIEYRRHNEGSVQRMAEARLPTEHGEFAAVGYRSLVDGTEFIALVMGDVADRTDVLVRLHSECLTGDALGSLRCDCRDQLGQAMSRIADAGTGVIVYLRGHEGRGIGLMPKLAAYALQDQGRDTVEANVELGLPADARDYRSAAEALRDLGIKSVRLLTNNPQKASGLEEGGVEVSGLEPILSDSNGENAAYLETKARKMGHLLDLDRDATA
jgi:3,4-dihydroxy 2-butanone 4-phosphate synthase/GTP cyclohydrolase II